MTVISVNKIEGILEVPIVMKGIENLVEIKKVF